MTMTRILLLVACLTCVPAWAQDAPIPPQVTVTLTAAEIAYIAQVLHKRPYEEVVALLVKIQAQVTEQASKPADAR